MNSGAFLIDPTFYPSGKVWEEFKRIQDQDWRPTWEDGSYGGKEWRAILLIDNFERLPAFEKFSTLEDLTQRFQCKIKNMMFYSLLPGGKLHPHRDMIGAVGLGGLRLHIPIFTHNEIDFRVSRKKVVMNPGELWALDTSYLHSVENRGKQDRVHLVFDVLVNDWIRELIPKPGFRFYAHQAALVGLSARKAMHTLLFNPRKLAGNLNVAKKVAGMVREKYLRNEV